MNLNGKKLLAVILVVFLIFSGCDAGYNRASAGASEFYNAMTVVQTSVPHIGGMDLRLDGIELLETDRYGRSLFRYFFALTNSEAFLIVQKTEGALVYYCEDYCYLYNQQKGATSESDINWLKEQNGWNLPTTARKTVCLDYTNASPDHVGIENHLDVGKKILLYLQENQPNAPWEEAKVDLNCLENYPGYGQIIYVVLNGNNTTMQCLVLYDQSAAEPVVVLENIQQEDDLRELIISFKGTYCQK